MLPLSRLRLFLLAGLLGGLPLASHAAAANEHWVGTWAAAPVAASNEKTAAGAQDETLREIVHVSLGGASVRIIVSNEFGSDPLTVGAASVGLRDNGSNLLAVPATVMFHGKVSTTIPAGALAVSDPIALKVSALSDLAISLFIPAQKIKTNTQHNSTFTTNYIAAGNQVAAKSLDGATDTVAWRYLKGVDVLAPEGSGSIVAFGDSITDGAHSTANTNSRWPDVLAQRLQAGKKTAQLGVLNEGIGGNRVLHDVTGPSALARFDRDVLAQAGVKYLIVLESINDIGHAADPVKPYDVITADDLIAGLSQLAARSHTHGIKIYGATITPYVGAKYSSPAGEAIRAAVNDWIRTTKELDGVIDFDKATRDPANPTAFLAADDSGDHLHPGDAGYKAMGASIDLSLFTK